MKRVLILTGRYLPTPSVNSVCIHNITQKMSADEYDITYIGYKDGKFITNNGEKIYRVSRGILYSLSYRLENNKSHIVNIAKKIISVFIKIKQLPFLVCWPYNDPIYTKRVYSLAKKLHKKNPFDAVIAVHMPLSSIIVGHKLKKKYPNILFYPYFLDSLSGGRPIRIMSESWNLKKKLHWEEKLLDNADKIIVMEASRKHHEKYNAQKDFFSRFCYLDIPLFIGGTLQKKKLKEIDGKINIVFCGTANYPMRNIKYFFEIANFIKNVNKNIFFTFIGLSNYRPLIENIYENIRYISFVPHDKLDEYLNSADIFLNLGVTTPSAISGKIFEYMSYGKPIISTYSIDNEACLPYLRKYPLSFLIDEREKNIEIVAKETLKFISENCDKQIDSSLISDTFILNKPETFIEALFGNK